MNKLIFILFYLMNAFTGRSQTTLEKFIELRDSNIVKMIPFEISKGTDSIHCAVKSFLSSGELSFKIVDPEGKIEGGFWLDTVSDGKHKPSSGRMTHHIKLPINGRWILQIKTTNATGNLSYNIYIH